MFAKVPTCNCKATFMVHNLITHACADTTCHFGRPTSGWRRPRAFHEISRARARDNNCVNHVVNHVTKNCVNHFAKRCAHKRARTTTQQSRARYELTINCAQ